MPSHQTKINRDLQAKGICVTCRNRNEDPRRQSCPACREKAAKARAAKAVLQSGQVRRGRPSNAMTVYEALAAAYRAEKGLTLSYARIEVLMRDSTIGPHIRERAE